MLNIKKLLGSGLLACLIVIGIFFPASAQGNVGATFTNGPDMNMARMNHWGYTLSDGRVVLFGGHGDNFSSLSSAEIWSPSSNSFTLLQMKYPHDSGCVARIKDGRFLIAGGAKDNGVVPGYDHAEIFDPQDNSFTAVNPMTRSHANCAAATLSNGKILIVGGWYDPETPKYGELFDPSTHTFTATEALNSPRSRPVVLPTGDGKAVVLSGLGPFGNPPVERVELYDPDTNRFSILQEALFTGETGWHIPGWPHIPETQRLSNGRYLLYAYRTIGNNQYEYTLFTFDPDTKKVEKVQTNPALPGGSEVFLWPTVVLVDRTGDSAYLTGYLQGTDPLQLRFYTVDLSTWTLDISTDSHTLPSSFYLHGTHAVLLNDGRIFLTGGSSRQDASLNSYPIPKTLLITPVNESCSYSILPENQSFSATGGTGTISVTASSGGCGRSAGSNASWITLTSGGSGTGSGTVAYSVSANSGLGSRTGTLTVAGHPFTVTQAGTGVPKISASPASVNVGSAKVGSPSDAKTVTLKNTGTGDLVISSVTLSGANAGEFSQTNNCTTIAAGSSCIINITLTPDSTGKKNAIMIVSSNDLKKSTINLKLSGQAMPPIISVSPTSLKFGSVNDTTSSLTKTVTINNTGMSDLVINIITNTGINATEFNQTSNCTTIEKGIPCPVTVTFAPISAGKKSAIMSISSNDPKKPTVNVKLMGQSAITAKPGILQFSAASYHINEGDGTATISVTRTAGSSGGVRVNYSTANGTAIAGDDYTAANGTLSWADGDSSTKTISIPIINDTVVESSETVTISLSSISGGATLGSIRSATLTIESLNAGGGTIKYQYDALRRLVRVEWPNGTITAYTYDAAGNRLSQKVTVIPR